MRPVKFSVALPQNDFQAARARAELAESLGYHAVSLADHFYSGATGGGPTTPYYECYTSLSAIAAATKKIRLMPLVTSMSYRNPALLAKMMATLDNISGGRLIAGVGAGWFKDEYDSYHYPYPSNLERLARLQDGIRLLKAMFTQNEPTYHGKYFSVDKAYCNPKPLQKPYPPILVGGGGKKLLKIAAEEADIVNVIPPVYHGAVDLKEVLKFDAGVMAARIAAIREYVKAAGRAPDAVELSGMSFVVTAKEKSQADAMVKMVAQTMGIDDVDAARRSPMVLAGTVDEVKREIGTRIEKYGFTFFALNFPVPDMVELFAKEIMPEFVK
ncbi:MAG: LLM class flavin-dependent oxidoreductase [Candidatus Binataceae bacterium]